MALQGRIGIIQGPPGCGKSFIGVKMLQLLLSLSSLDSPKVLVLTYKNHALDEFIKAAMKLFPLQVTRIGGRCKDAELDSISLRNVMKNAAKQHALVDQISSLNQDINEVKEEIDELFSKLNEYLYMTHEKIIEQFSEEQIRSLILNCDWNSTIVKGLGTITMDDGFQKAKKNKQKISNEEVNKVLEKNDQENMKALKNAAFAKWLPIEKQFTDYQGKLLGPTTIDIDFEKLFKEEEEKNEIEMYDVDDQKDITEIQEERMAAISGPQQKAKEKIRERIKKIEYQKQQSDDIRAFPDAALQKIPKLNCSILKNYEDVWKLENEERIQLVQHIIDLEKREVSQKFKEKLIEHQELCTQLKEMRNQETAAALEEINIIGMTITGAAIHQNLLREIRPEIVIVEEAAEVLEPQLIACIGSWTKYMLLIGDHKQLRPPVETYKLRRDYFFDVSLMERMINNKMPYSTLKMQNRQREEFAELLEDIYPTLKTNHERVKNNHPAVCLEKSSFFWHHIEPEKNERSFTNEEEANRAVRLALFLVQQGYKPEQITILAAYQGQTRLIRLKLKEMEPTYLKMLSEARDNFLEKDSNGGSGGESSRDSIKIHTIDMYQGDENDFVIISLVRSNDKNKIGFLREENRRCVAQSRAKCGVYFIGNGDMFKNNATWNPIMKKLMKSGRYGKDIKIKCQYHDDLYPVKNASNLTLKSFCRKQCTFEMSCGKHPCMEECQPPHNHTPCQEMIQFKHQRCGDKGERWCEEDEANVKCRMIVPFNFSSCGHPATKLCCQDAEILKCNFVVPGKKKECGHSINKKCHEDINSIDCKEICPLKMYCDHLCRDHECWEHATIEHCKTCEELSKARMKKQRKIEIEKRTEEDKKIEEEIQKLEKDKFVEVLRTQLKDEGVTASLYLDIEDQVKKQIQAVHNWFPIVTKIEQVTNNSLQLRWLRAKAAMFDPNKRSVLKFHGTDVAGVEGITKNGFRLPARPGMYGKGIYFATDSSKSAQKIYTKGSDMLLLCDVLLGESHTVDTGDISMNLEKLKQKKCDSLFAKRGTRGKKGVLFDEFVVFNPDQAFPRYIIYYKTANISLVPSATPFQDSFETSKKELLPKRHMQEGDPFDTHFRIAESQFHRLMGKQNAENFMKTRITKVEFYLNFDLSERFETKRKEFQKSYGANDTKSQHIYGFHGTKNRQIVENIMNNNFEKSRVGKFGAGVYFSEIPQYTFNYGGINHLILAKILPGKIHHCQHATMDARGLKSGYDSHGGIPLNDGSGMYQEITIFNVDQILPCYVIHFTAE